ncbi:hypothetical protein ALC60_01295 [Trachymyrmex zeteki]|uniref:BTB domain-containing protein n=1 Tax=Mycetomoellerius zeteki TaxID=64791 RepID=A0A151XGV2_9HYME|nr:hypothetical protein ALC60_01295 [Trachymyrmex zeteki]
MVEIPKDCVLQWAGHAGYITERFSGLLARQALVDVTLICDEQKLRVHKLVLASNSIYFEKALYIGISVVLNKHLKKPSLRGILFTTFEELRKEILQQDLGQEPIILLKDLDFEILKAMVEFMYCGETTISHQHLSSLHTAAQIFKVKELVSVIDTIVDSKKILDDFENCLKQQKGDSSLKVANNSLTEDDYICVRCDKLNMDKNTTVCENSNNNDISSNENQFLENDMVEATEHDLEHTLYEDSDAINASKKDVVDTSFSTSDVNISIQSDATTNTVLTHVGMVNEVQTMCTNSNRDNVYRHNLDLKPILYEQCCDFSCDVNESDQTISTLSQSCLPQVENDLEHCSGSSTDVPSTVGKCVKVYTPKRRRSMDDVRNKLVHTQCNLVPTPPHSTDSIDLLDEPSANDVPVNLLTSLDMESAEYILSLSTESIQSIVGGTISNQHTVIGYREINVERDAAKERLNSPINDTNCTKPILRRSMRLSQQESDETTSNSLSLSSSLGTEKSFKKGNSPNRTECARAKRKGKEDRKVPDHSVIASAVQSNKKSSNSKKTNSKLIVRKSNKSTYTVAGSKEREELRSKEESKPKANSKFKTENTEKSVTVDQPTTHHSVKSNVCKCISRALWGDMSDTLDYWENEMDLLAYPSNTEIPFAVGLLPLRTALEKMQATPDYQPRKTRSSVAPIKQDASNSLKRKYCTPPDAVVPSKKQNGGNNNDEGPNTVCHIEIRTAPSQCIKNRKRFLPDSITNLPTNGSTSQMASNNVG